MSQPKELKISISTATLIKVLGIGLAVVLVYLLWEVVAILIASLLLSAIIDPLADWFEKRKIKRGLAVATVYLILLALIVGIVLILVPTVKTQSLELYGQYEPFIQSVVDTGGIEQSFSSDFFSQDFQSILMDIQSAGLVDAADRILQVIADIFGVFISLILIFILSYYMVVEEEALRKSLLWITPAEYKKYIQDLIPKVRKKVGAWLRGQLLIMLIVFLVTYVFLLIAQVPYALVLALIAGLFEVVPFIGPISASIPALLIGLSISPLMAVIILGFYFALQQFEGDVLTPKVMQKVGGLNPIVSIFSIIIGFELFGVPGALLAIPVTMVGGLVIGEFLKHKSQRR